ncbi:MAG: citrate lyase acyl carrier protein [Tissierellia bacterium]|nr:citrate lyase acyl carrier protein [Tissierellia bacterium]
MEIKKEATCGTLTSNDCLITVSPEDFLEIEIESTVKDEFGDQIYQRIQETLDNLGVEKGRIKIEDYGALDFTIKARVETAIRRSYE